MALSPIVPICCATSPAIKAFPCQQDRPLLPKEIPASAGYGSHRNHTIRPVAGSPGCRSAQRRYFAHLPLTKTARTSCDAGALLQYLAKPTEGAAMISRRALFQSATGVGIV